MCSVFSAQFKKDVPMKYDDFLKYLWITSNRLGSKKNVGSWTSFEWLWHEMGKSFLIFGNFSNLVLPTKKHRFAPKTLHKKKVQKIWHFWLGQFFFQNNFTTDLWDILFWHHLKIDAINSHFVVWVLWNVFLKYLHIYINNLFCIQTFKVKGSH